MLKRMWLSLTLLLLIPTLSGRALQYPPLLVSEGMWMWSDPQSGAGTSGLWWWSMATAEPYTGCVGDFIASEVILSPIERKIVYRSTPEITIEKVEREGGLGSGGTFPNNLTLCDLNSGAITRIADQPADATLDGAVRFIARSLPAWSPDGKQLVWSEYLTTDESLKLMVYDLASGATTVLVEDLNPDNYVSLIMTPQVYWTDLGIHVANFMGLQTYSPSGEYLAISLPQAVEFFVEYEGQTYVAFNENGFWKLYDPITSLAKDMPGLPELYNRSAPDGLALRYDLYIAPPANDSTPPYIEARWSVVQGDQVEPLEFTGRVHHIVISPDGSTIAYIEEDKLWQWVEGEVALAPGLEDVNFAYGYQSLAWTPLAWRVGAP